MVRALRAAGRHQVSPISLRIIQHPADLVLGQEEQIIAGGKESSGGQLGAQHQQKAPDSRYVVRQVMAVRFSQREVATQNAMPIAKPGPLVPASPKRARRRSRAARDTAACCWRIPSTESIVGARRCPCIIARRYSGVSANRGDMTSDSASARWPYSLRYASSDLRKYVPASLSRNAPGDQGSPRRNSLQDCSGRIRGWSMAVDGGG